MPPPQRPAVSHGDPRAEAGLSSDGLPQCGDRGGLATSGYEMRWRADARVLSGHCIGHRELESHGMIDPHSQAAPQAPV